MDRAMAPFGPDQLWVADVARARSRLSDGFRTPAGGPEWGQKQAFSDQFANQAFDIAG
jgi:hypothetical protein